MLLVCCHTIIMEKHQSSSASRNVCKCKKKPCFEGCVHIALVFPVLFRLNFFLEGAHNETEKLLLKTLHAHSLPCYHHILGGLLPHFRNTSLDMATRMYLRPGVLSWVLNWSWFLKSWCSAHLISLPHILSLSLFFFLSLRISSEVVFSWGIIGQVSATHSRYICTLVWISLLKKFD